MAFAIEDNLTLLNGGGTLVDVNYALVPMQVGEGLTGLLKFGLQRTATYVYRVYNDERLDEPIEALEVRFQDCLVYLGAFLKRPKNFWTMLS